MENILNVARKRLDNENVVISKILTPREVKKYLMQDGVDAQVANKIAMLAGGITLSELKGTVADFPRLRKEQVLRFFDTEAMVSGNALIDSGVITRPHLITLVEILEDYTGLKMGDDSDAPLRYIDEKCNTIKIKDVAEFFANMPSRIAAIQAAGEEYPAESERTFDFHRTWIKSYLADCCGVQLLEINENDLVKDLCSCIDHSPKSYLTVVCWMERKFGKKLPTKLVENGTVGKLIDFFVAD